MNSIHTLNQIKKTIDQAMAEELRNIIREAALSNKLEDLTKVLTKEEIQNALNKENERGFKLIEELAYKGALKNIQGFYTEEDLQRTNQYGENVLHVWARNNMPDQIPKEFLTKENLMNQKDQNGNTPIDYLSQNKNSNSTNIPPKVLQELEETILKTEPEKYPHLVEWLNKTKTEVAQEFSKLDKYGENALHHAAHKTAPKATFNQIPQEALTPENLLRVNKFGETPLHIAALNKTLTNLTNIPLKTLKALEGHFQKDVSPQKNDILQFLKSQIENTPKRTRQENTPK